jgi:hypothetical protein
MQEYGRETATIFTNGLAPDKRLPRDSPFLTYSKNLKPSAYGLVSPEAISDPTNSTFTEWPFPQLFRGGRSYLKLDKTGLSAGTSAAFASLSTITAYNSETPASTKSVTAGQSWHTAFFHDAWLATNGATLVFKLPGNDSSKTLATTAITVKTLCRYRNRLVFGGVDLSTWGSGTRFQKVVNLWKDTLRSHEYSTSAMTPDTTFVFWSRYGGDFCDYPFKPFMAMMGVFGNSVFDDMWPLIERGIKTREMGFWPVQVPGAIQHVRELGDDIVAFGSNGMVRLSPTEEGGFMEVQDRPYGIFGRSACAGWTRECVFIGSGGDLYKWPLGSGIQKIGFRDIFRTFTAASTVISHDPYEDDYYITDGTSCYILNAWNKLGGPFDVKPTMLTREGTSLYGMTTGSATEVEFHCKEMSWGNRDSKSIPELQMEYENVTGVQGRIDWRESSLTSTYTASGWTPFNKEGVCFPQVSFVDGKIKVKATISGTPADVRFGGGEIRFQQEGKRFVRGISGSESRG